MNPSDEVIPRLRSDYGIERLDFVFMDHWKKCYSPDLQVTIKCHTKQGFSSVNEKKKVWQYLLFPLQGDDRLLHRPNGL